MIIATKRNGCQVRVLCARAVAFALLLNGLAWSPDPAGPAAVQALPLGGQVSRYQGDDFPLVPDDKAIRSKPPLADLHQLDLSPIGERSPLLLIHGGSGETRPMCRWVSVIDRFKADPSFQNRFKIYLFRYNSRLSLDKTVPALGEAVKALYRQSGQKPITVLALSMGGNLTQGALLDPEVDQAIARVVSLGTPFHGSPLFSSDWFQYSLDRSRILPWARTVHAVDYRFFFNRHLNYLSDLKWDNADKLIPRVGKFRSFVPAGPRGNLTPESDGNSILYKINTEGHLKKHKFITYAGYLHNPYLMSRWRKKLEQTVLAPYAFFRIRILAHLGREHPALRWLNREMASLRVDGQKPRTDSFAYKLNDGITPVNSAIWLPTQVIESYPMLEESDLKDVAELTDVRLARVFKNIDHVSFMDGKPPKGQNIVPDQMHPADGRRPLIDWMLNDLLQDPAETNRKPPAAAAK